MSEYPTLIVDGDPWDLTGDDIFDPSRNTVRIDGDDLPTVTDIEAGGGVDVFGLVRALRVGDKVTLATRRLQYWDDESLDRDWVERPFATATVAKVRFITSSHDAGDMDYYNVTVTDVEALR